MSTVSLIGALDIKEGSRYYRDPLRTHICTVIYIELKSVQQLSESLAKESLFSMSQLIAMAKDNETKITLYKEAERLTSRED